MKQKKHLMKGIKNDGMLKATRLKRQERNESFLLDLTAD